MNAKITIRKILFVAVWLCIGGGMLTLLLAAISSKKKGVCSDYTIRLKGPGNHFFIGEKEVEEMLKKAVKGNLKGQPVESFNLNGMEQLLEKNTWVSEAELYFDNKDVLHINVTEKEPVARLFTAEGESFYIDQNAAIMPLSEKISARVPVFTGFPVKKKLSARDSLLLQQVKNTAAFIRQDSFWMSQVAQIDISKDGKMEMVPVVGNHLVKLGEGEDIPAKFRRLMVFYQQVLRNTGMDHYKLIDVQYKGQVVASRYAGDPKIDSVQLRRNVEKLLRQSFESANDTVVKILTPAIQLEADSASMKNDALPGERTVNPEQVSNPNPGLEKPTPSVAKGTDGQAVPKQEKKPSGTTEKQTVKKTEKKEVKKTDKKKEEEKQPKAVMPKRTLEEENGGYN
jgi:cell division protein FtsQ